MIPTIRHLQFSPAKPQKKALKRTKDTKKLTQATFSPERRRLEKAAGSCLDGIDRFLDTFKDTTVVRYSLNNLYDLGNLSTIKFHQLKNPVRAIVQTLFSCSGAFKHFHNNCHLHRDIKGPNILLSKSKPKS